MNPERLPDPTAPEVIAAGADAPVVIAAEGESGPEGEVAAEAGSEVLSRAGAAVDIAGLTWRPYGRATPVLTGLDLRVEPGQRVLLVGPSGSGKSTLLRAIAGLLQTADSGELAGSVLVDAVAPQDRPGLVGMVMQEPGAGVVASSIGRDVAFGLENVGMPRAEMAAPVAGALTAVGLGSLDLDTSPWTLSGGEQQRLALAGALALSPRVLLLDEPTSMLDPENAAGVRSVVAEVVARDLLTLVVVEHRLGPWLDLVDRLVVIDARGAVVADGGPREVLASHGSSLVAQGIWVPGIPDPVPQTLDLDWAPPALAAGTSVATAEDVTVRHTRQDLGRAPREVTAVRGGDLTVRPGQLLALVGPSGAGKSSWLRVLGGMIAPTKGTVRLGLAGETPPHELGSVELARAVAWVPQWASATLLARTVRDELLLTARAVGLDETVATARAELLLDALGLRAIAEVDPRLISGGEQRRLAVAAAVLHQPSLVLADEPTVGQDRLTWAAVMGVLESIQRAGSGLVVTTHDGGVTAVATRIVGVRRPEPKKTKKPSKKKLAKLAERQEAERQEPSVERGAMRVGGGGRLAPDVSAGVAAEAAPVREPLVARAGPLSPLLASLMMLPLPALVTSWRQALWIIAAEVMLGAIALWAPGRGARPRGRWRGLLLRAIPLSIGVVTMAWSAWLLGGRDLEIASTAGLRLVALVLPSIVLLPFVDPDALGDHLAQRLHLPARPVVAATAALQRFQAFGELWRELMTARRIRGVGAGSSWVERSREIAGVTFALLVAALGQAGRLAVAMDARGFGGARRRTWAGAAPWRLPDTLVMLGGLLVVAVGVLTVVFPPG